MTRSRRSPTSAPPPPTTEGRPRPQREEERDVRPAQGKRIAFLMANEGVEQVELTEPLEGGPGGRGEAETSRPKRETCRPSTTSTRARRSRRTGSSATPTPSSTTVSCSRGASPTPTSCGPRGGGRVRPRLLRGRQAGRRDLPRALDADRGRRRRRAHPDLVAEPADRPAQRRRRVGRRGGPCRPGPGDQPQARRPRSRSTPSSSRSSRGRARGPA